MLAAVDELSPTTIRVVLPREWWGIGRRECEQHARNIAVAATLGRPWVVVSTEYDPDNERVVVKMAVPIERGPNR